MIENKNSCHLAIYESMLGYKIVIGKDTKQDLDSTYSKGMHVDIIISDGYFLEIYIFSHDSIYNKSIKDTSIADRYDL